MKKALVIGASGLVGGFAAQALHAAGHQVIEASRHGAEPVDVTDTTSVHSLYERVGAVDAVVCALGAAPFKPVTELTVDDYRSGFESKTLGLISVVTEGLNHVKDGGSFTLVTGVINREPIYTGAASAAANGALDAFVKSAALEMPRGLRINAVSPTVLEEAEGYHAAFPGFKPVPGEEVARAVVRSVDGIENGAIFCV